MSTIAERIHEIKEDLRKKNGYEYLTTHLDKLIKLESEIRHHTQKCFTSKTHQLQFTSGDLRIIATTIRTKLNKFQKKLYYEGVSDKFMACERTTDAEFTRIMNEAIADYKIFMKLSDCHYLYGTITATVELIEQMRGQ